MESNLALIILFTGGRNYLLSIWVDYHRNLRWLEVFRLSSPYIQARHVGENIEVYILVTKGVLKLSLTISEASTLL